MKSSHILLWFSIYSYHKKCQTYTLDAFNAQWTLRTTQLSSLLFDDDCLLLTVSIIIFRPFLLTNDRNDLHSAWKKLNRFAEICVSTKKQDVLHGMVLAIGLVVVVWPIHGQVHCVVVVHWRFLIHSFRLHSTNGNISDRNHGEAIVLRAFSKTFSMMDINGNLAEKLPFDIFHPLN